MLWSSRDDRSRAPVSNLNKKIYAKIETWRNRRVESKHPYLFIDVIAMKRNWAGELPNVSLLVARASVPSSAVSTLDRFLVRLALRLLRNRYLSQFIPPTKNREAVLPASPWFSGRWRGRCVGERSDRRPRQPA